MASQMPANNAAPSWHASYPKPESTPKTISRSDLLQRMKSGETAGKDFLLVDLRRTDYEGGTIVGSINLPAQSLYPTIPTVYAMVKGARIPRVIWYCGSSKGRGTRAAAWFADHVNKLADSTTDSIILEGGVAGWVAGGEEYVGRMLEYDASIWSKVTDP